MAISTDTPSGYVNNLTPGQEAKLQDMWKLLFTAVASVISAVYEVPVPDASPSRLFSVLDSLDEPTVDAVLAALKRGEEKPASANGTQESNKDDKDTGTTENIEEKSLEKLETLIAQGAEKTVMSEMASRNVSTEHFSELFAQLRKMGVPEGEIKSMQRILSQMSPMDMTFSILKMVRQEHPDSVLLRFLRARKWDLGKAFAMMASNIRWRKEMDVDDDIIPNGELDALVQSRDNPGSVEGKTGKEFLAQMRMGKSYTRGTDRLGRPINVVRVRLHRPGEQSEKTLERYIVHVIESNRIMVKPPVETAVCSAPVGWDLTDSKTGCDLRHDGFCPVKHGMFIVLVTGTANFVGICASQIHYSVLRSKLPRVAGCSADPQRPVDFLRFVLFNLLLVPANQATGIWKIIHPWMDPVVASKIHFTRSVTDMEEFVSRDQIPKELGGDNDFDYEYIEPDPEENAIMKDAEARDALMRERTMLGLRLLATTAAWISASANSKGKDDGERVSALKARRDGIIRDFESNYWKLDPYVRARALIDRLGDAPKSNGDSATVESK